MNLGAELMIALGSGIVSGLIAWGGIRVELRNLREGIIEAKAIAGQAHHRLDNCIMRNNNQC